MNIKNEPVVTGAIAIVILNLLLKFGIKMDSNTLNSILNAVILIVSAIQRSRVTPTNKVATYK